MCAVITPKAAALTTWRVLKRRLSYQSQNILNPLAGLAPTEIRDQALRTL